MLLLVSSASKLYPRSAESLGDFVTPARWQPIGRTPVWAADNGAFGGFDPDKFRTMLDRIAAAPVKPQFVAVPDVVGDFQRTGDLYRKWHRELVDRGIKRAYVLQNGIEEHPPEFGPPWNSLDALFIGGDTAFKLGPWVECCVHWARRAGIWVHMGRVNSVRRLDYARKIGCNSCDGSGMARFPRRVLEPMLHSLNREQLHLF